MNTSANGITRISGADTTCDIGAYETMVTPTDNVSSGLTPNRSWGTT